MPTSRFMAVGSLAIASILLAAAPARAAFDHLQCFKIKDNAAAATYTANINPSDLTFSALPASCTIKTPAKMLCVDAEKTNVVPAPPGSADGLTAQQYLCYKAKCTKVQPTATLTDQFGSHGIQVKSTKLVCAPIPPPCVDSDNDLFTDCAGDCNDSNASVNPGAADICNGVDDNCDGSTDDEDPNVGAACITGIPGICSSGTTTCVAGALQCIGGASPQAETCNNQDDNCDGVTDEGNPDGGGACMTGLQGVCSPGTQFCTGGALNCQQNTSPSAETCDGLDNNCNGSVDEGVCLANGAVCTMSSSCTSNQCVDGVCCDTSCSGTCEACSAAKKGSGADGTCDDIAISTDPDNECSGMQTCDGAGACQP